MRKPINLYLFTLFLFASSFSYEANAQVLEGQTSTSQESKSSLPSAKDENAWFKNPRATPQKETKKEGVGSKESPDWATPKKEEKPYIPQVKRPTLDGVKRGHASMSPVVSQASRNKVEDRFIFVYYSNFNIRTTMSGMLMCDIRFIILSTLDSRINNLNFRLKWPKMETSLSYEGVTPNTETYYDYTLLGEGCYSMDKVPNIIVNRCRVKGMSSQECASKIKWLRKQ